MAGAAQPHRETLRAYVGNADWSAFRSVVSPHAHTHHSREVLSDLPVYIRRIPLVGPWFDREVNRRRANDAPVDFSKGWWHPPVSARALFDSEVSQIDRRFGLESIVSMTDHDDLTAGLSIQRLYAADRAPISVEWTVPYAEGFFHLGIHDLPHAHATEWLERFAAFTNSDTTESLRALLDELHARDALIVLNHPLWDLAGIGERLHMVRLDEFLVAFGDRIHALELNGYRSRHENGGVRRLGADRGLPLISGGDRHALAPNALLNVTRAATFAEFAAEIRDRVSHIVVMPEYREPLAGRVMAAAVDVLGAYRNGQGGLERWFDRVTCEWNGDMRPLSHHWPRGGPLWVRSVVGVFRVCASRPFQPMWRAALHRFDGPPSVSPIPTTS
jgi:hypothetical protein